MAVEDYHCQFHTCVSVPKCCPFRNHELTETIDLKDIIRGPGCISKIIQLKNKQVAMGGVLDEDTAKNIEEKLDALLLHFQDKQSNAIIPRQQMEDPEQMKLITSLPLGIDQFNRFNEKIAKDSSFRQTIIRILGTAGGKDPKSLVPSVMRKLMTDDVGETFSLTGKSMSKTGFSKQAFEKTEVYKLVLEICFRIFSSTRANVVREAVSDWLTQSKFRKRKREKRMCSTQEPDIPVVMIMKKE